MLITIGLLLNLTGAILLAFYFRAPKKDHRDLVCMSYKDKVYYPLTYNPDLFYSGIGLLILGFIFQILPRIETLVEIIGFTTDVMVSIPILIALGLLVTAIIRLLWKPIRLLWRLVRKTWDGG